MTPQTSVQATPHLSTPELARELGLDFSPSPLVELDYSALEEMVQHVRQLKGFAAFERYPWDNAKFWFPEGTPEERSQYFTVGNAINFRFWRLVEGEVVPAGGLLDGERLFGSMYMWRCLRRCLDAKRFPLFQAQFLAELTVDQFDEIFSTDTGETPLSVASEDRIANLRDLGHKLETEWDGQFYNVVASVQGSLAEFVRASASFRAFDDPLLKLTMVNTILHMGSGITEFDAEPLPGIDYHLLKQMLRHGILVPTERIAKKLELYQLLSEEEGFELRRTALHAFVLLSELTSISGEILDNKWWWNRIKCRTINPVCLNPETAHECPFLEPCAQHTELGMPLEATRYY